MAQQPENHIGQEPEAHGLRLPEIEQKLSGMWAEKAERAAGEDAAVTTRVCTLNLAVLATNGLARDKVLEATELASKSHPLRVVVVLAEPESAEAKTEGSVSGYCRMIRAGDIQICCEQVVLVAKGAAVDELPSSTASLLVPDLPVVLWWTGTPPFEDRMFERLQAISDYLVVDSREFTDPTAGLGQVLGVIRKWRQVGTADLNWVRSEHWREQAAGLFDEPTVQPQLSEITKLSVHYSANGRLNPNQAVLLAGWFASRLKWLPTGEHRSGVAEGEYEATMKAVDGRAVKVHVRPAQQEHGEAGDIVAVEIEAGAARDELRLSGGNSHAHVEIKAHAPDAPPIHRTHDIVTLPLGKLIAAQVETLGAGVLYEESLAAGLEIIG